MERCKSCKHWKRPDNINAKCLFQPRDQDTYQPMNLGFEVRECVHPSKTLYEAPTESNGFALTDASEYFAALCTAEDFGCVRHEAA
jgi:hypothetical protein